MLPFLSTLEVEKELVYNIKKTNSSTNIDANWEKSEWLNVESLRLLNFMGEKPDHFPSVFVKLQYSADNLYIIFKVEDQYVLSVAEAYQGKVYEDSCVEFFFSPSNDSSDSYFNLETNCGGTQLFNYHLSVLSNTIQISEKDYKGIIVASSLPKINSPEIKDKITWYIEYKIPFKLISKYSGVKKPVSNSIWKANFYKCGDETSHPHWLTWNKVEYPTPNFHLPKFFGTLHFE